MKKGKKHFSSTALCAGWQCEEIGRRLLGVATALERLGDTGNQLPVYKTRWDEFGVVGDAICRAARDLQENVWKPIFEQRYIAIAPDTLSARAAQNLTDTAHSTAVSPRRVARASFCGGKTKNTNRREKNHANGRS